MSEAEQRRFLHRPHGRTSTGERTHLERRAGRAALAVGGGRRRLGLGAERRKAPHIVAEGAGLAAELAGGALHDVLDLDVRVDAVRAAVALELLSREAVGARH